jgi:polyphosphate kinase 2 (PPK2 family)
MGFCTEDEYEEFFRSVPEFERMLVRSGIQIVKFWFSITDDEQEARFRARIEDPLKQWKLSPMDLESRRRWEDYTRVKETMLERSSIDEAPGGWCRRWTRSARLNCIAHLLSLVPCGPVPKPDVVLPERVHHPDYERQPTPDAMIVPSRY